MIKKLFKSKIFILFAIVFLVLLPTYLTMPAESENRAIVLSVGIDYENAQYSTSVKVLVPKSTGGFTKNTTVLTGFGNNIEDCIQRIAIHYGKRLAFAHTNAIVLGEGLNDFDAFQILNYFVRSKKLNNNAVLVSTNKTAKDLLNASSKIEQTLELNMSDVVNFNEEYDTAHLSTMYTFFQNYFSPASSSFVSRVELLSNEVANAGENDLSGIKVEQSSGEQSSGESGSSGSGNSAGGSGESSGGQYISNTGNVAVYKNGKLLTTLEADMVKAFNWTQSSSVLGNIMITNVNSAYLKNATIVAAIVTKNVTKSYEFKNNIPRVRYFIDLDLRIEQIMQEGEPEIVWYAKETYFDEKLIKQIKQQIQSEVANAINFMKTNNVDPFNLYDEIDKYKHNEFQQYLKSLENKDEYMENIEFFLDMKIKGKIH